MPTKTIPEPWRSFLFAIDEAVAETVALHCLGGFVMTVAYDLVRPTSDVDVMMIAPRSATDLLVDLAGEGSKLHARYGVYFQFVGITTVPDNYEERLLPLFPDTFRHLHLLAFDPYDLALSKIERNIQRDRDDVFYLARTVPLDMDVLRKRYETELRPYLGNPDREDLTLKLWIDAIEEERS
jgi:hypothetical protein